MLVTRGGTEIPMSKVKVPLEVDGRYAVVSFECEGLTQDDLLASLESNVDLNKVSADFRRRLKIRYDE